MVGVIGIGNILLQDEGFGVHVINLSYSPKTGLDS